MTLEIKHLYNLYVIKKKTFFIVKKQIDTIFYNQKSKKNETINQRYNQTKIYDIIKQ